MLKQAALEFGRALADLRFMEIFCGNLAGYQLTPEQQRDSREKMQDVLGNLKRVCILSDLDQEIGPELDRFQAALSSEFMQSWLSVVIIFGIESRMSLKTSFTFK